MVQTARRDREMVETARKDRERTQWRRFVQMAARLIGKKQSVHDDDDDDDDDNDDVKRLV